MATLYVTDLDGTLLLPDGTLGRRTVEVVNAFIDSGGLITYATGRSFYSANPILQELNLHLPVVTYGGAILVDPISGIAESASMIPSSVVESLLMACTEYGLQPILFSIQNGADRVSWIEGNISVGVEFFLEKRKGDPRNLPLRGWKEIDLSSVFYISVIAGRTELAELRDSLDPDIHNLCHNILVDDIYTPGNHWLEFTSAVGTKDYAVEKVRSKVRANSLVCFGDSMNDLPMFSVADQAYAVSNSLEEVKRHATAIIGSNGDEGVARWLESQLFGTIR